MIKKLDAVDSGRVDAASLPTEESASSELSESSESSSSELSEGGETAIDEKASQDKKKKTGFRDRKVV